jgi:anti-sigma B factor antagonist
MKITEDRSGGVMVIRPMHARLDASSAPALREALIERISRGELSIVVDLGEVTFMDSSALGALIAAAKRLGPTGTIGVAAMTGPVAKLFSVTRMDRVFSVNANVPDAIRALGG